MAQWLNNKDAAFEDRFTALLGTKREQATDVNQLVADVIADVKTRGDEALYDYTKRFDRFDARPIGLRFSEDEIENAVAQCPSEIKDALAFAADRIHAYHQRQLPKNEMYRDPLGVELGHRWRPVSAAGLYVPGGLAAYPSSVLMNAIPAQVAGVERLVMVVPTPDGIINAQVLTAAHLVGIDEIYRIGGAQAIAALAHGTDSLAPVAKIVGPGNAYVAAAKRQVYGIVGIDMIAGPSEVLIIADNNNNPDWIAADLLAQAEHDASAQSILMTNDESFAKQVEQAVEKQLTTLPKADIAGASWAENGAIIIVDDLQQAIPLSDRLAPEHLEIATDNADHLAEVVNNAGSIFIGRHTPEAIGDYVAGPNHVLPTARSARFSSGLNVLDFMKRTSLLKCDAESLQAIGPAAVTLGRAEGLDAHANSVAIRLTP